MRSACVEHPPCRLKRVVLCRIPPCCPALHNLVDYPIHQEQHQNSIIMHSIANSDANDGRRAQLRQGVSSLTTLEKMLCLRTCPGYYVITREDVCNRRAQHNDQQYVVRSSRINSCCRPPAPRVTSAASESSGFLLMGFKSFARAHYLRRGVNKTLIKERRGRGTRRLARFYFCRYAFRSNRCKALNFTVTRNPIAI